MSTVVALGSSMRLRIDVQRIIGTGLHASLAANAAPVIKVNNPILAAIQRRDGTNLDAGSIVTMVATHHREKSPGIGEFTLLDILHPSPIDADWNVVLRLACHRAGVAADTAAIVDDETEIGQGSHACRMGLEEIRSFRPALLPLI